MTSPNPAIPIIRMEDYASDPTTTIQRLRDACINVGFFYLQGHSVQSALLESVFEQSKKLFSLPEASKRSLSDHVLSRGYTAMEEETLDPEVQLSRGDTKEGYYIGRDIPKDDPRYDLTKLRGPNQWPTPETTPWTPDECAEFKHVMTTYHKRMSQLSVQVVGMLALAIGMKDEHYFDSSFEEPIASLRLLHYPPVASNPQEGLFACGAHTDYGMITLLLVEQNQQNPTAGGLQLQTLQGDWINAPPPPPDGTMIVNLGDMLERWTNGLFRSTRHRVVMQEGQKERYSIPFFFEPSFDAVVECLDACCSADNPPKYPVTTAGEHLVSKYKQTHKDFKPV